jgi:transcriptional regulator with XRE-family HTH domain
MERQTRQAAKTATRGGRAARYFGGRLRAERERRGWTQVELAKRLTAAGWPVNPTVLAKIEAARPSDRRSVKVDEALAVAEVFGLSLDSLLGRVTANPNAELGSILRAAIETASGMAMQVSTIVTTLHSRFADLDALDYPGREELQDDVGQAWAALRQAAAALGRIGSFEIPDDTAIALRAAYLERSELPDFLRQLFDADRRTDDDTQP